MNKLCIIRESWRIEAFELWCWRRLLRVPWTARRSNQSTIKEINPDYSLKGLMLKLKVHYFGHPDMKNWLTGKDLMLRKTGHEEKGATEDEMVGWHHQLKGHESVQTQWRTGKPAMMQFTRWQRVGYDWATEQELALKFLQGAQCAAVKPLSRPTRPSSDEIGCWGWILLKMVGFHSRLENDFLLRGSPLRA